MMKCPKCGHPRAPGGGEHATCGACGLVFVKWAQRVLGQERIARSASARTGEDGTHSNSITAADRLGELILLTGLAWGGAVLYREYRHLRSGQGRG